MNSFAENLKLNIQADAAIVQIISTETLRIRAHCKKISEDLAKDLYAWNAHEGLRKYTSDEDGNKKRFIPHEKGDDTFNNPGDVLEWLFDSSSYQPQDNAKGSAGAIVLLENAHFHLSEPTLINRLWAHAMAVASREVEGVTLLLVQPTEMLPPELEKELQILYLPFPERDDLEKLLKQAKQRFNIDDRDYDESEELVESALGLSTSEAQRAFAKIAIERKRLTKAEIPLLVQEKEQVIQKSGLLEYFHPQDSFDDIGGLDKLKDWLGRRREAFGEDARKFGLEPPKGVLLLGLPGTGKSLSAKAVGAAWQLPLLRLDFGKVFGGVVGSSEANIRRALQTAEALAPSILWVDEIEKGLAGMQSSGATDGGTTARVLGTFLTWMQEKHKPVFVVATANDVKSLPTELLRKGRFDEIFFVDLPAQNERQKIIEINLKKLRRLENFCAAEIEQLAEASSGFTGAELQEAIKEAMFRAFDEGHELTSEDILAAIKATSPLAHVRANVINKTRAWAKAHAVSASSEEPEEIKPTKRAKQVPRLKAEGEDPFLDD